MEAGHGAAQLEVLASHGQWHEVYSKVKSQLEKGQMKGDEQILAQYWGMRACAALGEKGRRILSSFGEIGVFCGLISLSWFV